jgi:hypothetical protein
MAGQIDVTGLGYFVPIFGFLLVFVVVFAILKKLKILGDNTWSLFFTALSIGVIFVTMTSVRTVVENVVPWFALLIVAMFFIFVVLGFSQGKFDKAPTWLMWTFVVILVGVFLISLAMVYNNTFSYLLSGPFSADQSISVFNFFYSPNFWGSALLLIIAGLAAWVMTKK